MSYNIVFKSNFRVTIVEILAVVDGKQTSFVLLSDAPLDAPQKRSFRSADAAFIINKVRKINWPCLKKTVC